VLTRAIRAPHLRQKAIWQSALKHVGLPRRCSSNPYARLWPAIDRGHELPERFAPILLRPERSPEKKSREPIDSRDGISLIWAHEFRTTSSRMRTFRFPCIRDSLGRRPCVCIAVFRRFEEANQRRPHRRADTEDAEAETQIHFDFLRVPLCPLGRYCGRAVSLRL
jgi:hypothetical protein